MALKVKKTPAEPRDTSAVDNLEYNTQRTNLHIAEYGRGVQKMIDKAMLIEEREARTKAAQNIISVMGILNPSVREVVDFKHKLWDHLFIMSDFKLDVDSPFPKPEREVIQAKPDTIEYPVSKIRYKYYGKVMEAMIRQIAKLEDVSRREQISKDLANFMKMSYLAWNKDSVDDSTIFSHLEELSDGNMKLGEGVRLNHTSDILAINKEKMQRDSTNIRKNRSGMNNNKKRRKK